MSKTAVQQVSTVYRCLKCKEHFSARPAKCPQCDVDMAKGAMIHVDAKVLEAFYVDALQAFFIGIATSYMYGLCKTCKPSVKQNKEEKWNKQ